MSKQSKLKPAKPLSGRRGDGPHPIDIHVGSRVRLRRTLLGLSQEKLGSALGLTFQQVQKYERGANRIGASRLYHLASVLDVPVSYFFEDAPDGFEPDNRPDGFAETEQTRLESDPMARRETLELVRCYYRIEDGEVRRRLFSLIKALGPDGEEGFRQGWPDRD